MNEQIKQLALAAGLLNYVDHETPRRYFINGHAEQEEVEKFAELIVQECLKVMDQNWSDGHEVHQAMEDIEKHFGIQ